MCKLHLNSYKKREKKFRNKQTTILSQAWDKGRILSPTRNQTSDLWIPLSDALLLSHRGSIVNKAPYEFHVWHASCILLGSSILLVSHFVYEICNSPCLNILSLIFVQIQTKWKITFYQSNTGISEKRKSPRKTSTLIFGLIFGTPM